MHPDPEPDTRSPWYEAFAPHAHPHMDGVRWLAGAEDGVETAARPEAVEPDGSTEALFDCYNG
jgi:hypothetical protein